MQINLMDELCDFKYIATIAQKILRKEGVEPNLGAFYEDLESYEWSPPRRVQIPKPRSTKTRDIFIFKDKDSFLQKVITEILTTQFKDKIHEDVFSYTKGLRTFDGAKHIQKALRKKNLFGVKVDISNYFMNVSISSIYKAIDELIADEPGRDLLKKLFSLNKFFDNEGEIHHECLGIMPGCAISSFFANYLLADIDEYLHDNAFVYARYSDDLIFFTEDNNLNVLFDKTKEYLAKKGLKINPKKVSYFQENQPIDFLGLKITKNEIDINSDMFNNLKGLIKRICKKHRKRAELSYQQHSRDVVRNAIKVINRLLYKSCLSKSNAHKSNRLVYIFANITSIKTLRLLDFYICDSLRYVYTGKHNKGNCKYLSTKDLEELGFYSTVQAFNLFKISKDVFLAKVYSLGRVVRPFNFEWHYLSMVEHDVKYTAATFEDFYSLYKNVLESGFFIFNGYKVPAAYVRIDPVVGKISILNYIIMEGSKYLTDCIQFCICNKYYKQYLKDLPLLKPSNNTSEDLYKMYLQGSYTQNTSSYFESLNTKHYLPYFRTLRFEKLIPIFGDSDLEINKTPMTRYLTFVLYLYCHIFSKQLWQDLNYNQPFIIIGKPNYALVLKAEWLLRGEE